MKNTIGRQMQCNVIAIEYDNVSHVGTVWMEHGDCVDMNGAIMFFLKCAPNVQKIITTSLLDRDVTYIRNSDDSWRVIVPDHLSRPPRRLATK